MNKINCASCEDLALALRVILPYAEVGIRTINATIVGQSYPAINTGYLDRARVALAKFETNANKPTK